MTEGMMTAVGTQMLFVFSVAFAVGLLLGAGHKEDKIVERLKKADAEGKSLKDALKELTQDDEDESEVANG